MSTIKIQKADGTFEFLQTAGRDVEDLAQKALKADKKVDEFAIQLAETMLDILNASSEGAKGNKVKDDSVDIAKAIDKTPHGGTLYFPRGTFNVSNWITKIIDKDITIEGAGRHHTIIEGNGTTDFVTTKKNVTFKNIHIKGFNQLIRLETEPNTINDFVKITGCAFSEFTRAITAYPESAYGIKRIVVKENLFFNGKQAVNIRHQFIDRAHCIDNEFENLNVTTMVGGGIEIGHDPNTLEGKGRYFVKGNTFKDLYGSPGDAQTQAIILRGKKVIVDGNIIENLDSEGQTNDVEGIYTRCENAIVTNNILIDAARLEGALNIKNGGEGGSKATVTGNRIIFNRTSPNTGRGIWVSMNDVLIADNYVEGGSDPIRVAGNSERVIIQNNHVRRVRTRAISLYSSGKDFSIMNNTIDTDHELNDLNSDFRRVIYVEVTGNANMENLYISNNKASSLSRMLLVYVDGMTNRVKKLTIQGNEADEGRRAIQLKAVDDVRINGNAIWGSWNEELVVSDTTRINLGQNFPDTRLRSLNSGSATVATGNTSVTVTHGLNSIIPASAIDIIVTPLANLGGASFWVSDITATTFTINISAAQGGQRQFRWEAKAFKRFDVA